MDGAALFFGLQVGVGDGVGDGVGGEAVVAVGSHFTERVMAPIIPQSASFTAIRYDGDAVDAKRRCGSGLLMAVLPPLWRICACVF